MVLSPRRNIHTVRATRFQPPIRVKATNLILSPLWNAHRIVLSPCTCVFNILLSPREGRFHCAYKHAHNESCTGHVAWRGAALLCWKNRPAEMTRLTERKSTWPCWHCVDSGGCCGGHPPPAEMRWTWVQRALGDDTLNASARWSRAPWCRYGECRRAQCRTITRLVRSSRNLQTKKPSKKCSHSCKNTIMYTRSIQKSGKHSTIAFVRWSNTQLSGRDKKTSA